MKENEINVKDNELVWEAPRLITNELEETNSGTIIWSGPGEGQHVYSSDVNNVPS